LCRFSHFEVNHSEKLMIVGMGVDIVEIDRLRKIVQRTPRFTERVFTPDERTFCESHHDPAPHCAARFAAKEAVFKALGTGWAKGVTWLDVEVQRTEAGAPKLVLQGEALRLSQQMGAQRIHISLSHSDHYAIATVILEQ
jgi:holo-[acyl-carrier protein] synthase